MKTKSKVQSLRPKVEAAAFAASGAWGLWTLGFRRLTLDSAL